MAEKTNNWMEAFLLLAIVLVVAGLSFGAYQLWLKDKTNPDPTPEPLPPPPPPPPNAINGTTFGKSGAVTISSDGKSATVTGSFNIQATPNAAVNSQVVKVEFLINGQSIATETVAPYWLFGDTNGTVTLKTLTGTYPQTLSVRMLEADGDVVQVGEIVLKTSTTTPPPPPPAPTGINLLKNGNFLTDISNWGGQTLTQPPYFTWLADGKNDAGRMKIVINTGNPTDTFVTSSVWQSNIDVRRGDELTFGCWVRTTGKNIDRANDGAGMSVDLRVANDTQYRIFYAIDGAATINTEWTKISNTAVIPCVAPADGTNTAIAYSVSSGISGTILGANAGMYDDTYAKTFYGKPMPTNIKATARLSIWQTDSVKEAAFDNCELIVRKALTC